MKVIAPVAVAVAALVIGLSTPSAKTLIEGPAMSLFERQDPVELSLEAPLAKLFEHGTTNEDYTVRGTLTLTSGATLAIPDVEISVRGNTSKRESECPFPKLKVKLPHGKARDSILDGVETLRIGTHCGELDGRELTKRFGRLANETAAWREALVYRMLDAAGVATLKARPARITYIDRDKGPSPLVRKALVVEDDEAAKKRLNADGEIELEAFDNARDRFEAADAARVAFSEALVGNFDWCLKFSPEDTYRCDERKPLWNILALRQGRKAFPLIYDFDLAGPVTGRHRWFPDVYNASFRPTKSPIEVEVLSQVQRTRSLFPRDVLDAARRDLSARRQAVERAIADAAVDDEGRRLAREYAKAFFDAIATDAVFYSRVVVRPGTRVYADAAKSSEACAPGDVVPIGTPVNERARAQSMVEVILLDVMWRWAPPSRCEAVRHGTVWIDSSAVDADYPAAQRSR